MQIDELFYNAIRQDADIMQEIGGRIRSTAIEVPPDEQDNTPLPSVVVIFDGLQNDTTTKDDCEGMEDKVQVRIEVSHEDPKSVYQLIRKIRQTWRNYNRSQMDDPEWPVLEYSVQLSEIAWDWMKPCYFQNIIYNVTVPNDTE